MPRALGFLPAPPTRRAAAAALHRMSSLSSSTSLSASSSFWSPAVADSSPRKLTPTEDKTVAAATIAVEGTGGAVGDEKVKGNIRAKGGGGERGEKKPGGKMPEKTSTKGLSSHSTTGGSAAVTKKANRRDSTDPKATSMPDSGKAGANDAGGDPPREPVTVTLKGGGAGLGEASCGAPRRRKSDAELLSRLDSRVFRFLEAGKCQEDWCEVREEAHCHRGPGCDCTR